MIRFLVYYFIAFCMFLLLQHEAHAQTTAAEKSILLTIINRVHYKPPIIYTAQVPGSNDVTEDFVKRMKNSKFYVYGSSVEDPVTGQIVIPARRLDSLTLTSAEQKYIIQRLTAIDKWEDHLFDSSIRVDDIKDGMDRHRLLWDGKQSINRPYVFIFRRPVFIRNGSICLLSIVAMCGGECGFANTSFYRKKGKNWEKWIRISGGEF